MPISKIKTSSILADAASTNLNIDANTLFLDVANNRVGIGTNNPSANLDITNAGNATLRLTAGNTSSSIIQLGDTDDGNVGEITYSHSTNSMAFDTNDVERMRIDSSGNVGIGTASPSYKLQVNGSADIINAQGTTANAFYRATSVSAVGDFSWGVDDAAGVGGGNSYIIYDRKNSAYRFIISNAGNVGIGDLTPPAPGGADARVISLQGTRYPQFIYKATSAAANSTAWRTIVRDTLQFQIQTNNDALSTEQNAYEIIRNSGLNTINYHAWYTGSTEAMRLTSGNLLVGTTTANANLYVYGSPVSFAGLNATSILSSSTAQTTGVGGLLAFEGQYGVGLAAFGAIGGLKENSTSGNYAGYLAFYTRTNGSLPAERMRITSAGDVGIGTTTPSSRLEIIGTNPKLTINANDNVNGRNATLSLISGTSADPTSTCQIMYGASNQTTSGTLTFIEGDATTERMRITPAGEVVIGATAAYGSAKLSVAGSLEARGNMKSYASNRAGLAIGASVDLFTIPAGSYGTAVSMIVYVQQRDDNIGALSNYQYSITGWGGSGVTVNVASSQGYGAGSQLTVTTGAVSGSAFVTLTNSSGRVSTSLDMTAIVLVGYTALTWGW